MTKEITISVPEAGMRYFGLCRNASYDAAKRGEIPTVRIGRLYRVPVAQMEKMLDTRVPDVRGTRKKRIVSWEWVHFEGPVNAHLFEKDEIDVQGAPWLSFNASEGRFDDRMCEPYVTFNTSDDSDNYAYRRPLKEILEYKLETLGSSNLTSEEQEEVDLAEELLSVINKWTAKNLNK